MMASNSSTSTNSLNVNITASNATPPLQMSTMLSPAAAYVNGNLSKSMSQQSFVPIDSTPPVSNSALNNFASNTLHQQAKNLK